MVTAAREHEDVQLAAYVADIGVIDSVTFLRGSDVARAVWLAEAELRVKWENERRAAAAGKTPEADDDD